MSEQQPTQRPALRRSSSDRMIGGVCGGIARTLGVDPVVVRVIAAVLGIIGGAGFAAYVIAWIVIPSDEGTSALQESRAGRGKFPQFLLVVILAFAVLSLVDGWGHGSALGLVACLVVLGIAWQAFGSDWYRRTTVTHTPGATGAGVTVENGTDAQTVTVQTPMGSTVVTQERKSPLGKIVWNLIVATVGVMIALNWADITDIPARAMIITGLVFVGIGLLVSAFVGRARGLIVLGIVLTSLLLIPQGVRVDNGTGNRHWTPISAAGNGTSAYELGVGDATLDLQSLDAETIASDATSVTAHVGVGNLVVLIPRDALAQYVITATVTAGDIALPDRPRESGVNHTATATLGNSAGPVVTLDLSTDIGNLEVRYA